MGTIKILTGIYKNKKINFNDSLNLRPLLSRIKLIFFEIIKEYLYNANILDCFAGSGSLGFESISNNAKKVTFVDENKINCKNIEKYKKIFKKTIIIKNITINQFLKNTNEIYDIIFIDPPLKFNNLNKLINNINSKNITKQNSLIFIQTLKKNKLLIPENWLLIKNKQRKNIIYYLYKIN